MLPLFLVLVFLVDLLRSQISVRVCIGVSRGNTPEHRQMQISVSPKSLELAPWFIVSPVTFWRTGSTSTALQTILSISVSKSRSSLMHWIMNPPRWHTIALCTLNSSPHAQIMGVSVISQSYGNLIASLNSFLFRLFTYCLLFVRMDHEIVLLLVDGWFFFDK